MKQIIRVLALAVCGLTAFGQTPSVNDNAQRAKVHGQIWRSQFLDGAISKQLAKLMAT